MTNRLPFENMIEITDPKIVKSNYMTNKPRMILDGTILYQGKLYYFKYNHDSLDGIVYAVFEENIPIMYFSLFHNEKTDKYDSIKEEE